MIPWCRVGGGLASSPTSRSWIVVYAWNRIAIVRPGSSRPLEIGDFTAGPRIVEAWHKLVGEPLPEVVQVGDFFWERVDGGVTPCGSQAVFHVDADGCAHGSHASFQPAGVHRAWNLLTGLTRPPAPRPNTPDLHWSFTVPAEEVDLARVLSEITAAGGDAEKAKVTVQVKGPGKVRVAVSAEKPERRL